MPKESNFWNSFLKTASFSAGDGSLYRQEPRYEDGVRFKSSISRLPGSRLPRSIILSSKKPAIPFAIPYTFDAPHRCAVWKTPARLELITAVGPPDCPAKTFILSPAYIH